MREILFYIVILLSNIIQGITGFAGTILAMPFSIKLVGLDTAVPVLNLLGLLSGIYVYAGNYKKINWIVLKRVVVIMGISLFCGVHIKTSLSGNPKLLYMILGCIVLFVAVKGLINCIPKKHFSEKQIHHDNEYVNGFKTATTEVPQPKSDKPLQNALLTLLLIAAGVVHGMFVCGGPLLISYMTKKLPEKASFRATISTVWIFLNGFLLVTHIFQGLWTPGVIKSGAISIPFLLGGMFIGGKLYSKMSQEFFVTLTYILLIIAGISLFLK